MRANRDEASGLELAKRFLIEAYPTVIIFDPEGSEIDRILGYKPTSDVYQDKVLQIEAGIGTPKALADFYAKDPKNVPALFRLARKYDEIGNREKALDKYREVIALDPDGNVGTTDFMGAQVSCTDYAEFSIGLFALKARQLNPEPMLAFVRKHPHNTLTEAAYENLSYLYYEDEASKQDAEKFFSEYQSRFPRSPYPYHAWAGRILYYREKDAVEKGIELEKNALALNARVADANMDWTLAKLYELRQDKQSAGETYGRQYIKDRIGSFQYSLIQYAEFWVPDNTNSDHAVEIAELALTIDPENNWHHRWSRARLCTGWKIRQGAFNIRPGVHQKTPGRSQHTDVLRNVLESPRPKPG
jgi:tetratricopeptide (TPR) repeat protein